jgi:signal transduction histidine kinase
MQTCKSLTWEISPTSLYDSDIAAGLERMAHDLKRFFGLEVLIQTAGSRIELDRESSAVIFRCAKELLVNIAKHSGSHTAEVGISRLENKVHMVVSDQGKGFSLSCLEDESSGFGLFSIRERLVHMNGSLQVDSEPGKGTKVLMVFPLKSSPKEEASGSPAPPSAS